MLTRHALAFLLGLAGGDPPGSDSTRVVQVLVPLCSNDQVVCGSTRAGDPDDLDHNLYWGAVFGHRTFATRKASPFQLVARTPREGDRLERLVVRHRAGDVETLLVIDGYHGASIDGVVDRFFTLAERGGSIVFRDGDAERRVDVDVVGFAGHNRMMDGKAPPPRDTRPGARPIPSFVLACDSVRYFDAPLRERGSTPLVLTRSLMAPEGYVLEAVVLGLAAGDDRAGLRRRAGRAYARWQSLDEPTGLSIFAKLGG